MQLIQLNMAFLDMDVWEEYIFYSTSLVHTHFRIVALNLHITITWAGHTAKHLNLNHLMVGLRHWCV